MAIIAPIEEPDADFAATHDQTPSNGGACIHWPGRSTASSEEAG